MLCCADCTYRRLLHWGADVNRKHLIRVKGKTRCFSHLCCTTVVAASQRDEAWRLPTALPRLVGTTKDCTFVEKSVRAHATARIIFMISRLQMQNCTPVLSRMRSFVQTGLNAAWFCRYPIRIRESSSVPLDLPNRLSTRTSISTEQKDRRASTAII